MSGRLNALVTQRMHTMHQLLCTKRAVRGKVIYNKVMDRSWLNNNLGGTPTNARIPCPEYQVGREGGREREERREAKRDLSFVFAIEGNIGS